MVSKSFRYSFLPLWMSVYLHALKRLLPYCFLAITLLFLFAGSFSRVFDAYELQTYDWRVRQAPARESTQDVVIIEIWDDALEAIGSWPVDRKYHAALIDVLRRYQARLVGFDVLFVEPNSGDEALARTAQEHGSVFLAEVMDRVSYQDGQMVAQGFLTRVIESLKESARGVGHVNAVVDLDGKRRRIAPIIQAGDERRFHLGLLMAIYALDLTPDDVFKDEEGNLHLGKKRVIPMDENGHALMFFAGSWGRVYRHVSYLQILQAYQDILAGKTPSLDLNFLKNKICFVGLTATGTHDINPVPTDRLYPQIGLHADMFNNVLQGNFVVRLERWWNLAVLGGLVGLGFLLANVKRLTWSILLALLIWLSFFTAVTYTFYYALLWVDLFYPSVSFGVIYLSAILMRTRSEKRARERLEVELSLASRIQRNFLPTHLPTLQGLELDAFMRPAEQVGGDLYDVLKIDQEHLGIMCGDVSGKGVPAALFMARSVAAFKFHSSGNPNPAEVLAGLNDNLAGMETSGLFVTMNYAVVDNQHKKLTLSTGGHLPVLQVRRDGRFSFLDPAGGMPLGLLPEAKFENLAVELEPEDIYVFYSDGVTEARNRKREDYESDRLLEVVREHRQMSVSALKEELLHDIQNFVGHAPQHDDLTFLILKVTA